MKTNGYRWRLESKHLGCQARYLYVEEPSDCDEPSAEEIAQMRLAAPEEAVAVDAMILGRCSERWQKVANVVGQLLDKFEAAFAHLPFAYIQARMQELADKGELEIMGDVWSMRHSEIRLRERQSELSQETPSK